ncbi:MAG TPA: hypothetical protein VHX38_29390 [Pseudonocardiaceae bacterium]|nr:hypothetical protein [Pseudonocardiaceae bacterium]
MTYNFFVIGELDRARLATALAALTAVPVESVDLSDSDDQDDRNWGASVSCMYAQVYGDVSWLLDIYLTEDVPRKPDEPTAAAGLAEALGTAMLYAAPLALPSAYWLAAPGGLLTRARLHSVEDSADERISYRIDAVAQPVPQLPTVPIDRQPEVIREYRVPAPITAELHTWLESWQSTAPVAAEVASLVWRARTRLGAWENLTARMAAGWPPDGWYPAVFYIEDLRTRDELAATLDRLPEAALTQFGTALAAIDANFRLLTGDDTEAALAGISNVLPSHDWWWHRIPKPLPWIGT